MPKSRKRGGEKAHRKRVQARNNKIQNQRNQMQRLWEEEMMKRLEEMNKTTSGDTENQEIDTSESVNIQL
jgi:hypothetical protein